MTIHYEVYASNIVSLYMAMHRMEAYILSVLGYPGPHRLRHLADHVISAACGAAGRLLGS